MCGAVMYSLTTNAITTATRNMKLGREGGREGVVNMTHMYIHAVVHETPPLSCSGCGI